MYNITKGQLWVLISATSLLTFFFLINVLDGNSTLVSELGVLILPFSVAFYIVGWKNRRKKQGEDTALLGEKRKKILRWIKILLIGWLLLSALTIGLTYLYDQYVNDGLSLYDKKEMEEYVGTINRLPKHIENANSCIENITNEMLAKEMSTCQENYDRSYGNYQDCLSYGTGHNFCSNLHDYEKFKCSEEEISGELKAKIEDGCFRVANAEFAKIQSFERRLVDRFIGKLPAEQSTLNSEVMEGLYSQFPESVFDERTKGRLKEYIEKQGYIVQ